MKHYIKVAYVAPYAFQALEEYLNQMAEKGWRIQRMREGYLYFKKCAEHKHIHVCLIKEYHKEDPVKLDEHVEDLIVFMKEFGMDYVCGYGPFQIFEGSQAISMHSDDEVTLDQIKRISKAVHKPYDGFYMFFMVMFLLLAVVSLFVRSLMLNFLFDHHLWLLLGCFIISSVCIISLRRPFWKLRRCIELPKTDCHTEFSTQRSVIYALPVAVFSLICAYNQMYGIFIFYFIIQAMVLITRYLPKIGSVITIVCIMIGIAYILSDNPYFTVKQVPQYDITEQISQPYDSYRHTSSLFGEYEEYRILDQIMIQHYQFYDSMAKDQIQGIVLAENGLSEIPLHIVKQNRQIIVPVQDDEIWVFYDFSTDSSLLKEVEAYFS